MLVVAAALFGLIALLATLQYRWLGRVSDAERDSRRSTLSARAAEFASDFDKELTLAYMLFQIEPALDGPAPAENISARMSARYDRWIATARYPRLVKEYYVASRTGGGAATIRRFDTSTRFLEPAEWPASLGELRAEIAAAPQEHQDPGRSGNSRFVVRTMASALWDEVPALVIAMPMVLLNSADPHPLRLGQFLSYTVLLLDRDYITREILPALAQQHLRGLGDGVDYQLAVVSETDQAVIYRSTSSFAPKSDAKADARADLFQLRPQEFSQMAADVRRFIAAVPPPGEMHGTFAADTSGKPGAAPPSPAPGAKRVVVQDGKPMSIVVDQNAAVRGRAIFTSIATATMRNGNAAPRWRLLVKHPSGSLEAAVNSTRRRNLAISSGILAVLGASMALLVLSTRRSQEIARQQMEFVAAVSHELRTPLAVIRSAGDNLAAGVVAEPAQVGTYGELVRAEGRRLSEMVEQILEFAGIQSGQRRFEPRPVDVATLLGDVIGASASLIEAARIDVQLQIPPDVPPVLGDEPALRRVFQNLLGNAIKYGADGRWIGLRAQATSKEVCVSVADRGIGIPPAEQSRIFEPFYRAAEVIAAQIQGAGLGLSLVQRIIEAHGGRIAVKSAPGEGSEFSVYLPAAGPEPVPGASPAASEAPRYS